jgi:hypothetical protein
LTTIEPIQLNSIEPNQLNSGSTDTELALQRIQELGDIYEPGTLRERGYLRSIASIWQQGTMSTASIFAAPLMPEELESVELIAATASNSECGIDDEYGALDSTMY